MCQAKTRIGMDIRVFAVHLVGIYVSKLFHAAIPVRLLMTHSHVDFLMSRALYQSLGENCVLCLSHLTGNTTSVVSLDVTKAMRHINIDFVEFIWSIFSQFRYKRLNLATPRVPFWYFQNVSKNATRVCPPVRRDNPRALASRLSYIQVEKHGRTILYHFNQCRPCKTRYISCLSW